MEQKDKPDLPGEYFEKLEEWQEHQYDPGYYTGGRIRPLFTHNRYPRLLGWYLIIGAAGFLVLLLIGLIMDFCERRTFAGIQSLLPACGVMILLLLIGRMMVKNGKR